MGNIINDKIAIVVVLYNQDLYDCKVYKTLLKDNLDNIDCLLVFDNSEKSSPVSVNIQNGEYKYICNGKNLGLSANYNYAAKYAHDNGYGWLLLLDEDTTFPQNALAVYKKSVRKFCGHTLFAPMHRLADGRLLSPSEACKKMSRCFSPGLCDLHKYDVINSGMLVCVDSFIKVGGYKDDVSLDFSDFQFMERYKTVFKDAVIIDLTCVQDFSNNEVDENKLLSRFNIYCNNVLNFEFHFFQTRFKVTYLVVKHTLALCVRCKTIRPLVILLRKIICKTR